MRLYKIYLCGALALSLLGSLYGLWSNFWLAQPSGWKATPIGKYVVYPRLSKEFVVDANSNAISIVRGTKQLQEAVFLSLKSDLSVLHSIDGFSKNNEVIQISGWVYSGADPIIGVALLSNEELISMSAVDGLRMDLEKLYGSAARISGFHVSNDQSIKPACELIAIGKSMNGYRLKNICE